MFATAANLYDEPAYYERARAALGALGYEEGKNLRLDWRNLPDEDAAYATAREFTSDRVDLIVAFENQTARAAKAATAEIPVVFLHVTDAVVERLVKTLAHPGGNLTGFVYHVVSPAKRLELFKEIVPRLRRVLVLVDPRDPVATSHLAAVQKTADVLKLRLVQRAVVDQTDLHWVFGAIKPGAFDGVISASVDLDVKFTSVLIGLASTKRLPLASYRKERVHQGALFSYAPDIASGGATRRAVRRQDSQRRQARRPARGAANKVRDGHQLEGRQGARPHGPAVAAAAGGSRD